MNPRDEAHNLDWVEIDLGRLASFKTGPFGSTFHKSDYVRGGVPLINPSHIVNAKIVPDPAISVSLELARQLSAFALQANDIVIGRRGDMGRCAVVRQEHVGYLCGTGSMIVRPKDGVSAELLQTLLSSPQVIAKIEENSVGTTMINLNQGTLSNLKMYVPRQSDEQKAIAEALSDADALIEGLERLIAKKRLIKQGAMQDLLTAKRCLPGFSGEWRAQKFGQIARIRNDKVQTFGLDQAEHCIELEQLQPETGKLLFWTTATDRKTTKYAFQKDDVLFGRLRPYLRKFYRANQAGVCSTEIWPLMATGISPLYLYYTIQMDGFISAACDSYGTHMPRADWGKLVTYELSVPCEIQEQEAIGTLLSDMDAEIRAFETRLDKARQIKEGMMQNLLTGRIRLV